MYAILCETMKKGLIISLFVLLGLVLLTWGTERILTQLVYSPARVTARINEAVKPLIPLPYSLGESRLSIHHSFPLVALETENVVLYDRSGRDTLFYAPLMRSMMTWRDWNHPDMMRIQLSDPVNEQLKMTLAVSDIVPAEHVDSVNPLVMLDTYLRLDASVLNPYIQEELENFADIVSHLNGCITQSPMTDLSAKHRGVQGTLELRLHFDTCRWNTLAQLDWNTLRGTFDIDAAPLNLHLYDQCRMVVRHYHVHSDCPIADSISSLIYLTSPKKNPDHISYAYHAERDDVEIHFPSSSIGIPSWSSDYYGLYDTSVGSNPSVLSVRKQNLRSLALRDASKSVYVLHPRMMMQGMMNRQNELRWDCFVQLDSVVVKHPETFLTLRSGKVEHHVLDVPSEDLYPDISIPDFLDDIIDLARH